VDGFGIEHLPYGVAQEPRALDIELESGGDFLRDGDTIVLRGRAGAVTLGEIRGTVV
jgi:hypothetical protein